MDAHALAGAVPEEPACGPADRVAQLFDAHHERLYRLARRLSANADDALDLVQETYLRVARAGSIPLGPAAEEAWLVRVLVNLRRDDWRRTAGRRAHDTRTDLSIAPASDPESRVVARMAVGRALEQLDPRRRSVLMLHELEGLSTAAVASLLGITQVTVRWHLSRGRRELARLLAPLTGDRS